MLQLLSEASINRETLVDSGLRFVRRKHGEGFTYFIQNSTPDAVEGWISLETKAESVVLYDPIRVQSGLVPLRKKAKGITEIFLRLAPSETCIAKTYESVQSGSKFPYWESAGASIPLSGVWDVRFVAGGPILPEAKKTDVLTSWTEFGVDEYQSFSGTAIYEITFERPELEADAWLIDLGAVAESARVSLNGKEIRTIISAPYKVVVTPEQLDESNTLQVAVTNPFRKSNC